MRRARYAKVCPVVGDGDRWYAVLYVDGQRSDWTCGHRHLNEVAARLCVRAVEADADSYLDRPGFTEQSLGVASVGLWSGPVQVLRHMEWRSGDGRRRAFVTGSERALVEYVGREALRGARRDLAPGSPRGDLDPADGGAEHPDLPAAQPGHQPEVL